MNGQFGAGYNQTYNPKYEASDTNFLDEQMLAGVIALIAHTMHENRDTSAAAGMQADMWFDYLANNWVPKWTFRTTVDWKGEGGYRPPAELGLQNAINWVHPTNPEHDDIHQSFGPTNSKWTPAYDDGSGPDHQFPVRVYAHPYLMSLFQYWAMGEYFSDVAGSAVTRAFTAEDFIQEAQTREHWWYQQTTLNADGSRDYWLHMERSNSGLNTAFYGLHVSHFLNALHYNQVGRFSTDASMVEYAKVFYTGPNAGSTDVYNQGDVSQMRKQTDGSGGNVPFVMRSNANFICWDDTGELESLTRQIILSPLRHRINGKTNWAEFSHYSALISCSLRDEMKAL
jgi:hypothetical protein